MSITTYSELQTALTNWSGRADLSSRIPEFIALAEAKMNRRLRVKDMVTKTTFSITGEYVAVPTSFGGVKTFYLNTNPTAILQFMPDQQMTSEYAGQVGVPIKYSVQGGNFRFGPPPDATYSSTLVYYLQVPALSGSNTTNWMLTSHPDAYMYGGMAELSGFIQDAQSAQAWAQAMYGVIDEIKVASNRDATSGDGAVAMRPA